MKRFSAVAAALLLAVSASFASWDYFPPNDAKEGEAKVGFGMYMPNSDFTATALTIGARYSIISGLEASVILPLPTSMTDADFGDVFGLSCPIVGIRYWVPLVGIGFMGDFVLPVDTREGIEPDFDMTIGLQYLRRFTPLLQIGSEIRLENLVTDGADIDMGLGSEMNLNLGIINPFFGIEWNNLFANNYNTTFDLIMGVAVPIGDKISIDASLQLGIAGYKVLVPDMTTLTIKEENETPMIISAHISYSF